jgi:WD40 repeat protein
MIHETAPDTQPDCGSGPSKEPDPLLRVLGERRFHTDGGVLSLAFDPDGRLWSVEAPGVLREWDKSTGKALRSAFLSDVETMWAFSDDGHLVASASDEIIVWDVGSGEMLTLLQQPSWVTSLVFRSDPPLLVSGHDDGVARVWDIGDERVVHELRGHDQSISAVALSADGRRVATASEDRTIRIWDVTNGRLLGCLERHTDRIVALAWHPRGMRLVSAAWDRTARLWDLGSFEPVMLLNSHADQVTALAFNPDGSCFASADSAHNIHLWESEAANTRHVLAGHKDDVSALAFSHDGRMLASGGADRTIRLWDPFQGGASGGSEPPAEDNVHLAVAVSNQLFRAGGGSRLRVWDLESGRETPGFEGTESAHLLASDPAGRWLATAGPGPVIRVWNAATRKLQHTLEGPAGGVSALAFTSDSRTLAAASSENATVWLWAIETGTPILVIPIAADGCSVQSLAFHPGGKLLAAGGIDWLATSGSDGAVCLWDVVERCRVTTIRLAAHALTFDASGRRLAGASSENSVFVWDLPSQMLAFKAAGHKERVTSVTYSPNGKWLVSAGEDRMINLWTAETGRLWAAHECETAIRAVAFSPDGSFLFTGNGNATSYQLSMQLLVESGSKGANGAPIRTSEGKGLAGR